MGLTVLLACVAVLAVAVGRFAAPHLGRFAVHVGESWREGMDKTPAAPGMCAWCKTRPTREGSRYCSSTHEVDADDYYNG